MSKLYFHGGREEEEETRTKLHSCEAIEIKDIRNNWNIKNRDLLDICQKYIWDMYKKSEKYAKGMHKICLRYAWEMSEIYLK